MARDTLVEGSTLTAIADAIREKTETSDVMYPSEMAGKIRNISMGIELPKTITAGDTIIDAILLNEGVSYGESVEIIGVTIKRTGTYKFRVCAEGGRAGNLYLYKNGAKAKKFEPRTSNGYTQYRGWHSVDLSCNEGDRVSLYAVTTSSTSSTAYTISISCFAIAIDWKFDFFNTNAVASEVSQFSISKTAMTASGIYVTIPTTATYKFMFEASKGTASSSVTCTAQLYKNGKAINGATAVWDGKNATYSGQIACNEGDRIEVYGKTNNTSYEVTIRGMKAEEVY